MSKRIPWGPDSPGYPNCPVPAGHDVTVWSRDGGQAHDNGPEVWSWDHWGDGSDIIAYCDHDAPDEARELLAECRDLFRTYEHSHAAKANEIITMGHSAERDSRLEKAARNGDMADKITAYLERTA